MKKTAPICTLALAAVVVTGCSAATSTDDATVEPAAETASTSEAMTEAERVEVPDVVGMDSEDANELLEELGFDISRRGVTVDDEDDDRTVVRQDPGGGEVVDAGDEVSIGIGRYTEPEAVELGAAQARVAFRNSLDDSEGRTAMVDLLETMVESVDKYAVEGNGETLVIATTSRYATDEYVADDGWDLARELGYFWSDEFWSEVEKTDDWWPTLDLTVSSLHWQCDGAAMRALATRSVSRAEWEASCGR